ncbi:nitroreductase family protein [Tichowtungia aerotolerans]|uniref:NAD(P)H nitroreductase n=1 Tax=Tichowtungia aerotolerans TaxID=2697043 RepID=A0A6P1MDP2_9BACT|nr:nitroreductase family protein [Tichowtungia aerotolerans]QHI69706.1 NAD(P)H nitroreductase [Tichowtungia aerotolerans]
MSNNTPLSNQPFLDLVKHRTSCRSYRPEPAPKEALEKMIEAARMAPSACNRQPWQFAVVTDKSVQMQLISKAFLPGIPMRWAEHAGAIIALGMKRTTLTHQIATKISGVDYPLLDMGIAGEHLVLQAEELGLGTCWIGWIKPKIARRIVGWPRSIEVVSLITVGRPDGERQTRPRRSIDEITKWI